MDGFRGIGLVLRTPRLFLLALWPALGSLVAYIALGIYTRSLLMSLMGGNPQNANAPDPLFGFGDLIIMFSQLAVMILWLVIFPFAFTALASVFFPLVYEHLSRAAEETVAPGETIPDRKLSFGEAISETLGRLLFNGVVMTLALAASLFLHLGPVPGILATVVIALLDFTAPAFQRRGIGLGGQFRTLFPTDGATLGFAITAALLAIIPVVGVLCFPGLAVGGTLLARKRTMVTVQQQI